MSGEPTTLFVGPTFHAGEAGAPDAAAAEADASGRVVALHEIAPPAEGRRVVRLPGALALPGLHDAHLHLEGVGLVAEQVDLRDVASPREVRRCVRAFAEGHPEAASITGFGWDQSRFPGGRFPTWHDLEGATDRPALLYRIDGHAAWANGPLLRRAGVDAHTDAPEGGRILRDDDGEPTGVLIDAAIDLVSRGLPEPTDADRARWLLAGAEACADAGLVAVHTMSMDAPTFVALRRLAEADALPPLRVFAYLDGAREDTWDLLESLRGEDAAVGRVTLCGVKLFADGALGSRGAALLDDYADDPGHRGLLVTPPDLLRERAARAHALGWQVAIHAIGDRGNRLVLDVLEPLQGADEAVRHRVEHAQVLAPDDVDRLARSGLVASMQPTHCTSDMRWIEARLGQDRLAGASPWRSLADRGALLAFGSDAPIETHRPGPGVHAALTRQDADGWPEGGWRPEERLDLDRAIAAFTRGAARAVQRDHDLGRLRAGYRLDLTVLDRDPRRDPAEWLDARATATVVDGVVRRG